MKTKTLVVLLGLYWLATRSKPSGGGKVTLPPDEKIPVQIPIPPNPLRNTPPK